MAANFIKLNETDLEEKLAGLSPYNATVPVEVEGIIEGSAYRQGYLIFLPMYKGLLRIGETLVEIEYEKHDLWDSLPLSINLLLASEKTSSPIKVQGQLQSYIDNMKETHFLIRVSGLEYKGIRESYTTL